MWADLQRSNFVTTYRGTLNTAPFDIEGKAEDPSSTTDQQLHLMLQSLCGRAFQASDPS
jgi:hypothetical protein